MLSDAGATLGRVLFYDTRMSHDGSTSCASCHRQENGFSDPNQFSAGINGQLTGRHSMALANGNYYVSGAAFWDERAESLEAQALIPIESPSEMGSTLSEVVHEIECDGVLSTIISGRVWLAGGDARTHRQGDCAV